MHACEEYVAFKSVAESPRDHTCLTSARSPFLFHGQRHGDHLLSVPLVELMIFLTDFVRHGYMSGYIRHATLCLFNG